MIDIEEIIHRKILHSKKSGLTTKEWMKRDWDKRAHTDVKYFIKSNHGQTEKEFWNSGFEDRERILGINTLRYQQIFKNKDPQQLKVLEIGSGIGRVLIPMSKIFGEAIGVDVSEKMVEFAEKYMKNIANCRIFCTNGSDLSKIPDSSIDFCYSIIVFQHIPDKEIVINYIREVARVLKPDCLFRFQVFGDTKWKPKKNDTWYGAHFSSEEINKIAEENNYEILEETGQKDQYYWITFKLSK